MTKTVVHIEPTPTFVTWFLLNDLFHDLSKESNRLHLSGEKLREIFR